MLNPWWGIALILTALVGAMLALSRLKQRYGLHPEWSRKLLHMAMGLVVLSLPWLFRQAWPVLLLVAITIPLMLALRHPRLRRRLGSVVCDVKRGQTLGEIYFPLGVASLFLLAGNSPLLYTIPLLVLTLADAAAALVGLFHGQLLFRVGGQPKSIEGSLAFFSVAVLCSTPLLIGSTGLLSALLTGLTLSLLLTVVEAAAPYGLDNLLLPLLGHWLLTFLLALPAGPLLALLFISTALLLAAAIVLAISPDRFLRPSPD